MIPDWVLPAKSELGDDIDFIVNCVPGIDDELKKECFEVFKRAVVILDFCSENDSGVFVCRSFEMFHDFLHSEWSERGPEAEDTEFREMMNSYGMTQRKVDEETESRKEEVNQQEKEIMNRIRSDIELSKKES